MKPIGYVLLRVYDVVFCILNWKRIIMVLIAPFVIVIFGLICLVFQIYGPLLFALLGVIVIIVWIIAPFMWAFEKLFPNSPLFRHQKMPESFRRELVEASFED